MDSFELNSAENNIYGIYETKVQKVRENFASCNSGIPVENLAYKM